MIASQLPVPATPAGMSAATIDTRGLLNLWACQLSPASRETYSACLEDFRRFVQADTVDEAVGRLLSSGRAAAKAVLLAYLHDLHEGRGLAPNTVNLRLAALKSLLAFAESMDIIGWRVKVKPLPTKVLRDTTGPPREAVRKMLDAASDRQDPKGLRDAVIMRLLFDLGLRRKELAGLDIGDVDLIGGRLRILGKGRTEPEWLTLPTETAKALEAWLAVRGNGDPALFVSLSNRDRGQRISGRGVYSIVRRLGTSAAGLRTSPHRLRHSSITTACGLETDLQRVKAFSRHASIEMVGIYSDHLADAGGEVAAAVAATL